jgi:hypothetical protein
LTVGTATITGSTFNDNGQSGINCPASCALGQDTFRHNAAGGSQWSIGTEKDMGGNVCFDHACP